MRTLTTGLLFVGIMLAGCGGKEGIPGKYHMVQNDGALGAGTSQMELELKEDKTYTISAGSAQWFIGTWSVKGEYLTISSSNQNIGTTFRVWKGQLIPFADGKEILGWNWSK